MSEQDMVGIIFTNNINLCPYIEKYIEVLQKNNINFEIIIWDRQFITEKNYKYNCAHIYKKNRELKRIS